ncbi:MAG: Fe-Mn family superoxide dismutase [Patescibacteria group bacterium]
MKPYTQKTFNIPELKGISKKNIEEHLKLYAGYVKNANLINEKIAEYKKDAEGNAYALGELQRRFSFEYNGIRNHEYYFDSLAGGAKNLDSGSPLRKEIEKEFGSFEDWLNMFKAIALTRGIGWAVLAWDHDEEQFVHIWVDEQHIGQLNGVCWILGLDMWEHAYVYDYPTSEKKKYIEAFFDNLNWEEIEKNFLELQD